MNERENNKRGIFYGVIGVATLVVAVIGATFAYFTASQTAVNSITGNMATITFDLSIEKVTRADDYNGGMIPLSNTMVEAAIEGASAMVASKTDVQVTGTNAAGNADDPQICVDDNGNAVCQIYKISVVNGGTAGMFLDGYVTLTGGSGVPTDVTTWNYDAAENTQHTSMRWAQVFCEGEDNKLTKCSTAGVTTTGATSKTDDADNPGFGEEEWAAIDLPQTAVSDTSGFNRDQIVLTGTAGAGYNNVVSSGTIQGNAYDIIDQNYIRISDRDTAASGYNRKNDVTSALVYNQFISPMGSDGKFAVLDTTDSTETETDAQIYYIVVWLSESGFNQTAGATGSDGNLLTGVPETGSRFFSGTVTFVSAQGSEVTATFGGFHAVPSDSRVQ